MRYRFDQIAVNVKEKKKPVEEDKRYYIGLEHLNSGSLRVSRWGADVAPKGEKLLMQKGDVLFGKRRAYQKKVAIAPFDGIFSAHGMVLRPNEEIVDKDFFPMFISSDYFLDAANALSVGSLSPTINWRDLARAEFELPPMEKQRELGQLLWVMEDAKVEYQRLLAVTEELVKSRFIELFGDPVTNPKGVVTRSMPEICRIIDGDRGKNYPKAEELHSNGYCLFLNTKNVTFAGFRFDNCMFISKEKDNAMRKGKLERGDIVLTTRGTIGNLANYTNDIPYGNVRINSGMVILRLNQDIVNASFFIQQFRMQISSIINKIASGTAQPQLPISTMNRISMLVPPLSLQNEFAAFVEQTDKSKFDQLGRSSSCLMKTILRKK